MQPQREDAERAARPLRVAAIVLVWLAGLGTGFYALLSIAVRYGCSTGNAALGCTGEGSLLGSLIVIAVIVVVTATTVLATNRSTRAVLALTAAGLVGLAGCLVAAKLLLDTV